MFEEFCEILTRDKELIIIILISSLALFIFPLSTVILRITSSTKHRYDDLYKRINSANYDKDNEYQMIIKKLDEITQSAKTDDTLLNVINPNILEVNFAKQYIKANEDFDNTIEDLIREHHREAIKQSIIQFWLSIAVSCIGFLVIIIILLFSKDLAWYGTVIRTAPAIIVEIISYLFFTQAKETRNRAAEFLNRLNEDRKFSKSLLITETLEDEKLKSLLKAEIVLNSCGIKSDNILLNYFDNNEKSLLANTDNSE